MKINKIKILTIGKLGAQKEEFLEYFFDQKISDENKKGEIDVIKSTRTKIIDTIEYIIDDLDDLNSSNIKEIFEKIKDKIKEYNYVFFLMNFESGRIENSEIKKIKEILLENKNIIYLIINVGNLIDEKGNLKINLEKHLEQNKEKLENWKEHLTNELNDKVKDSNKDKNIENRIYFLNVKEIHKKSGDIVKKSGMLKLKEYITKNYIKDELDKIKSLGRFKDMASKIDDKCENYKNKIYAIINEEYGIITNDYIKVKERIENIIIELTKEISEIKNKEIDKIEKEIENSSQVYSKLLNLGNNLEFEIKKINVNKIQKDIIESINSTINSQENRTIFEKIYSIFSDDKTILKNKIEKLINNFKLTDKEIENMIKSIDKILYKILNGKDIEENNLYIENLADIGEIQVLFNKEEKKFDIVSKNEKSVLSYTKFKLFCEKLILEVNDEYSEIDGINEYELNILDKIIVPIELKRYFMYRNEFKQKKDTSSINNLMYSSLLFGSSNNNTNSFNNSNKYKYFFKSVNGLGNIKYVDFGANNEDLVQEIEKIK